MRTLPNGMRYAIRRNTSPKGAVSVRLRMAVGSLMERDNEQGIAHMLEHMAFRGSEHVADGDVVVCTAGTYPTFRYFAEGVGARIAQTPARHDRRHLAQPCDRPAVDQVIDRLRPLTPARQALCIIWQRWLASPPC